VFYCYHLSDPSSSTTRSWIINRVKPSRACSSSGDSRHTLASRTHTALTHAPQWQRFVTIKSFRSAEFSPPVAHYRNPPLISICTARARWWCLLRPWHTDTDWDSSSKQFNSLPQSHVQRRRTGTPLPAAPMQPEGKEAPGDERGLGAAAAIAVAVYDRLCPIRDTANPNSPPHQHQHHHQTTMSISMDIEGEGDNPFQEHTRRPSSWIQRSSTRSYAPSLPRSYTNSVSPTSQVSLHLTIPSPPTAIKPVRTH
jgi:hypothetical protein